MATDAAKADVAAAAVPGPGGLETGALPPQVITTPAAEHLMETLRAKYGALMFHQSGGCCDGSSPMCYPLGEFMTGDSDVLLATIEGAPFYMSRSQFEYWKH